LGICYVCGAEVSDDELHRCGEYGKAYRDECTRKDGAIKELGFVLGH